jgi:hypothetical protein
VHFSPLGAADLSVSRLAFAARKFTAERWDRVSPYKVDAASAAGFGGARLRHQYRLL